jgi:membrane protein DedA with SNARE-associated domain
MEREALTENTIARQGAGQEKQEDGIVAEILKTFIEWYMGNITYGTVALLMAVESSFIPFPSEVVVPPAAWKAAQGQMNVFAVVAAATAGALIGAIFNYCLALILGRPLMYRLADTKWAHMLLIKRESLEKAEAYFNKYGRSSTFIGRLVPAVRQLISLPAGISRMNLPTFLLFTMLGSGLWNVILAILGYFLYSQKEVLEKYYSALSLACLALGAAFVLYIILKSFVWKTKKAVQG